MAVKRTRDTKGSQDTLHWTKKASWLDHPGAGKVCAGQRSVDVERSNGQTVSRHRSSQLSSLLVLARTLTSILASFLGGSGVVEPPSQYCMQVKMSTELT
ncbi:hypothetical protein K443DRAFT_9915 [Laccaria amethystina LaAM-08-1]|uniref:Uncharacterized protein n=1 Tax=Laccaria amethystina LaAM-08-1 TaxID=1095629 RepID=A0A0C9XIL7_9AGAR|nr:hypothetical protein K443DRAFT_9915 [Laccaria amethystina LaAM-08-1]